MVLREDEETAVVVVSHLRERPVWPNQDRHRLDHFFQTLEIGLGEGPPSFGFQERGKEEHLGDEGVVGERGFIVEPVCRDLALHLGKQFLAGELSPVSGLAELGETETTEVQTGKVRDVMVPPNRTVLQVVEDESGVEEQGLEQLTPEPVVPHPAEKPFRGQDLRCPDRHIHRAAPVDPAIDGVFRHERGDVGHRPLPEGGVTAQRRRHSQRGEMLETGDLPGNLVILSTIGCMDHLERIDSALPALARLEVAMPVGIRPESHGPGAQEVEDSVRHGTCRRQDRLARDGRHISKSARGRRAMTRGGDQRDALTAPCDQVGQRGRRGGHEGEKVRIAQVGDAPAVPEPPRVSHGSSRQTAQPLPRWKGEGLPDVPGQIVQTVSHCAWG